MRSGELLLATCLALPFQLSITSHSHMRDCVQFDNCKMNWPASLIVDMTPPPKPMRMISDHNRVSSADGVAQYFISSTRIDPIWIFDEFDLSERNQPVDQEPIA